jgi:VIT1/CCC1 family predicted Fe2+/Mn2+ transporter
MDIVSFITFIVGAVTAIALSVIGIMYGLTISEIVPIIAYGSALMIFGIGGTVLSSNDEKKPPRALFRRKIPSK